MDFFQHRYYRINKLLLKFIGQWPYQTASVRRAFLVVIFLGTTSQIVPQILAMVKHHHNWDFLMESAISFIFETSLAIKLVCSISNSETLLKLLDRIRTDWQLWSRDEEIHILHKYAKNGKRMTIVYTVTIVSSSIVFTTQPVIPKIIDVLIKNGSEPGKFALPVDYYKLDVQKYYFYISAYSVACVTIGGIITIAINAIFIVYVQHSCALFAATGNKLQRTGVNRTSIENEKSFCAWKDRDAEMEHLIWCINRHNDAIEYTELIEATYSRCFFFLVGCNMLTISIAGFQILRKLNDPRENARFIIFLGCNMGHLYMESYWSQILMDHSSSIRDSIHNGEWYTLSPTAQKLLILIIMRCNVPCRLTAGKISTMSIKSFMTILHTSLSYFTLLCSI